MVSLSQLRFHYPDNTRQIQWKGQSSVTCVTVALSRQKKQIRELQHGESVDKCCLLAFDKSKGITNASSEAYAEVTSVTFAPLP
jgi:hypothetical protein